MTLSELFITFRYSHFLAVMLMFGISLFMVCLAPAGLSTELRRYTDRLLRWVTPLTLLSAIGILAMQAGLMGDGWADTYQFSIWKVVLGTTFGQIWRWQLLLTLVGVLGWWWLPYGRRYGFLLLLSSALMVCLAQTGHAAMYRGFLGALHRGSQFVHLMSAAYWFGSLYPLLICLSYTRVAHWRSDAIATLRRFSYWGHLAVALVIASGVVNGVIILAESGLNIASAYQQQLLLKVGLVVLMVIIALLNRYRIVPAMRQTPQQAQRLLVIATWLELILGALVLLLVSSFATLQPY